MTAFLPATAYRITRGLYATSPREALSGKGGLYLDGRWNSKGKPIIYAGESTSLCLLERLVHADELIAERHPDLVMLTLQVPHVSFTHYSADEIARVDPNWREEGNATCRALGDAWLDEAKFCAMIVPSAADGMARNILFNPAHAEVALLMTANASLSVRPIELDNRVVSLARQRRAIKL